MQKAELGPFANEDTMPEWLHKMLRKGAEIKVSSKLSPDGTIVRVEAIANETPYLVNVLSHLSYLDKTVEKAYYCHPAVHHVAKLPREGGFCGYRNIQMMISYIREAQVSGCEHFPGARLPNILQLQDMIETAWDTGINSQGRIETGGIRGTRKYIGTPEAQAFFLSMGIECECNQFSRGNHLRAHESLLLSICDYFDPGQPEDRDEKVVMTDKPPIYFQHQGHSLTIVGLEVRRSGAVNLVVYDPVFNPNPVMKKLARGFAAGHNTFRGTKDPSQLLRAHRRGELYLSKYSDFEILKYVGKPHLSSQTYTHEKGGT